MSGEETKTLSGVQVQTEFGRELLDLAGCLRALGADDKEIREAVFVRCGARKNLADVTPYQFQTR